MLHSHLFQPGPSTGLASTGDSQLAAAQLLASQSAAAAAAAAAAPKEELKTHFATREGIYRVMTLAEYSRPNRVPLNQMPVTGAGGAGAAGAMAGGCAPVRVSFLTLKKREGGGGGEKGAGDGAAVGTAGAGENGQEDCDQYADRICFNVGRELYVYIYKGVSASADLSKPIDKRVYKGTYPTCHDFNQHTASASSCSLIIGFSAGQIQLIDPFLKEYQASRLFNEDRLVDKTSVTCLKWLPGTSSQFLVSHSSGCIYLYNEELPCAPMAPVWTTVKQGDRYTVSTCKSKTPRNPVQRWEIGRGAVNEFSFSPCEGAEGGERLMMATVSHDGWLRIFSLHEMDLVGQMKSYFGGLLCCAWSPDRRLVATGGEDDMLTVYSVAEKRIVCRGQAHRSWISQVAFDPYASEMECDGNGSDGLLGAAAGEATVFRAGVAGTRPVASPPQPGRVGGGGGGGGGVPATAASLSRLSLMSYGTGLGVCYRVGSVGHDTQICLWDITEDVLKQTAVLPRHRNSTLVPFFDETPSTSRATSANESSSGIGGGGGLAGGSGGSTVIGGGGTSSVDGKEGKKESKKKRLQRRGLTLAAKLGAGSSHDRRQLDGAVASSTVVDETRLGTRYCPRMDQLPLIEPLVCKKIAHDRVTVLSFREDCIVTACQEGFVCSWARPGRGGNHGVPLPTSCSHSHHNGHNGVPMPDYAPGSSYWSST